MTVDTYIATRVVIENCRTSWSYKYSIARRGVVGNLEPGVVYIDVTLWGIIPLWNMECACILHAFVDMPPIYMYLTLIHTHKAI